MLVISAADTVWTQFLLKHHKKTNSSNSEWQEVNYKWELFLLCLHCEFFFIFCFHIGNVRYIWTSGRKCNFNGCDRPDLQPQNINGWFWSGSGAKIGPTTQRNSGDWSNTGGFGQAQPDNREAAQVIYFLLLSYSYSSSVVSFDLHFLWFCNTWVYVTGQWRVLLVNLEQLLQRRHQVARRSLPSSKTIRLRGQWRTSELRPF